ncbi:MAG TPA: tRNA (adenosine(37)-N6)-threonylcarbamoyltransferase complex dimerization subunit type 1 TsaB [Methylomirabilota bacterium]|nr:tRNA (adenosine(37)-N6)-threonylcarbamoyltransferase complex dimerization subunit type 1 TsaB [Methylomirabilota bacterium]
MLVLALDTALDRTAVAVTDGRRISAVRTETMDRGHAERLFPLVAAALAEAGAEMADIERIVVTTGPGSFTGIRVAIAAARGLALACGRPVVGVDTLVALAGSLPERPDGPVLAAIDARRGEIYAGLYDPSGVVIEPPFVADAEAVLLRIGDRAAAIVGSGAPILAHQAAITGRRAPPVYPLDGPDPLVLARLGAAAPAPDRPPTPLYLRAPDAKPQVPDAGLLR